MTDRQKVIKGLTECVAAGLEKACSADCPYFLKCFPDVGLATPFMSLMADALSMLKEQDAVEPRKIDGKRNHFIKCGNCNYDLVTGFQFCPHCGREVKWE